RSEWLFHWKAPHTARYTASGSRFPRLDQARIRPMHLQNLQPLARRQLLIAVLVLAGNGILSRHCLAEDEPLKRYLYVAAPGVRDYLEYGGHGLLVFDID